MDKFIENNNRVEYLTLLRSQGNKFGVKFIAYNLMTIHVHFLAISEEVDSLARVTDEAHRLYARI